jgi:hypothetical protein
MEITKENTTQLRELPVYDVRVLIRKWNEYEKLNKLLLPEIEEHKKEDPKGLPNTNPHCWRGMKKYKCEDELQKAFTSIISPWINRYLPNKSVDAAIQYWTNINEPGGWNDFHHHRFANFSGLTPHLSGIYYIEAEDTGVIRFTSTEQMWGIIPQHMPFCGMTGYIPKDGDVLLWQSHILHDVPPNPHPTKQRINIAFNVGLTIQ